jgi:hypothetical protein
MYAVLDLKAGNYTQPYYCANENVGIRMFDTAVNDPQTMMSKYPADFMLFEVGEFDDSNCMITQDSKHKMLCTGDQLVRSFPPIETSLPGVNDEAAQRNVAPVQHGASGGNSKKHV